MKLTRSSMILALFVLCSACSQDEQTASQSVDEDGLGVPSGVYAVDKLHTYLTFSYLHQGLSYPLLRATGIDGELDLDTSAMEKSSVGIAIDVDTIRSNVDYFDKELASPKFFNAGKFPKISFASKSYESISETDGALSGFITIRGITKPLILTVKINGALTHPMTGKPVIGFSASGYVSRSDFGLDRFVPAVADRVDLKIEAEFEMGSNQDSAAAAIYARETLEGADPATLESVAGNTSGT
jgi:polyisoprenoid-binding protein YceI